MDFAGIEARVRQALGEAVVKTETTPVKDPVLHVQPERIEEVCRLLEEDPELRFDLLISVTAIDYPDPKSPDGGRFDLVYHFLSTFQNHRLVVKAAVPRNDPVIPTVSKVYGAANWHERETFDFFGISFAGHDDLRRILCCEDWVGYPLRKDYVFPKEYHGIAAE
jgi:NADH-quinone oxidoreductase subunit C